MTYNLLFDTEFKDLSNWEFINCYFSHNQLISTNKVFGIKQKVILADATKLYLRCKYNILNSSIFKIYIGIEVNGKLYINKQWTKKNKERLISIVEDSQQEIITIHIIFEAEEDVNEVYMKEPLLYDLNRWHKAYWLKFLLDKRIKYDYGYQYKNLLDYSEIKPEVFNLDNAKIGSIISAKEKISLKIDAKLFRDKRYLCKLDYTPINNLGKVYLSYGVLRSKDFNSEQCYLSLKAQDNIDLYLIIEPNDILPYQLNLKHLLLVEIDKLGIDGNDIPYLPFI